MQDEHHNLHAHDDSIQDEEHGRYRQILKEDQKEQIHGVDVTGWQDHGGDEIDEHHNLHGDAAYSAHGVDPEELEHVMYRRINPTTALREGTHWEC